MFLRFEDNPNCGFVDDRVYTERSAARAVTHVLRRRGGLDQWCPVVGMDAGGKPIEARACKVEDSGEGICYLVFGGLWGLRLREPDGPERWDLEDARQWGEGFLLLPADGADLRFA